MLGPPHMLPRLFGKGWFGREKGIDCRSCLRQSLLPVPINNYLSSYSYSGTASVTLYHAHYWVVEFHPRTAATRSLEYVPLYVSLLLRFPVLNYGPL